MCQVSEGCSIKSLIKRHTPCLHMMAHASPHCHQLIRQAHPAIRALEGMCHSDSLPASQHCIEQTGLQAAQSCCEPYFFQLVLQRSSGACTAMARMTKIQIGVQEHLCSVGIATQCAHASGCKVRGGERCRKIRSVVAHRFSAKLQPDTGVN